LSSVNGIKSGLERVEGIAMAVSDDMSKVGMVVGINVIKEAEINHLNNRVFAGSYLLPDDKAVLIGNGLADYLHLGVNDTIVLLGQGYHGAAANGKYPVKGIVKFGSPELSKQLVFLPLNEAQWFYNMEGMINNMVLDFDNPAKSKIVLEKLKNTLGSEYEVMEWKEIMPEISNMIKTDRMEGYVFMFILYMVVGFGILGTTLMMLAERTKEFGVLISIGMKRLKLAFMVWMEIILISIAGTLLGITAAYPICKYFNVNPIRLGKDLEKMTEEYGMEAVMATSLDPLIFMQQAGVILIIASLISAYPFFKISWLNTINAMRK
jgi:ABC-type lipoprotein release transport system permease subunit